MSEKGVALTFKKDELKTIIEALNDYIFTDGQPGGAHGHLLFLKEQKFDNALSLLNSFESMNELITSIQGESHITPLIDIFEQSLSGSTWQTERPNIIE